MTATVQGNGTRTKVSTTTATANSLTLQAHETQPGIVTVQVEGHQFSLSPAGAADLIPYLQHFVTFGTLA